MAPIHAVARDPELKGKVKDLTQYLYKFDEQIIVEGLVKILKPFKVASEMLSSTRDPTLSLVLPSLHDMKQKLQPVVLEVPNRNEESDEEEEESDEMKAHKVLEKVKGKMLKLIDEKLVTTEHHEIASMLDPATKGWIIQKKSSDYVQKKLIKMISENANEEPVRIKQEPQDDSENTENVPPLPDLPALPDPGPSSPDQKKVKIENEPPSHWLADVLITKVEAPDPKVAEAKIQQEVDLFMMEDPIAFNIGLTLKWWSEHANIYPRLAKLAKKYLCTPASSVPSERIWSLAGNILTKKRSALAPENLDLLIFLHHNRKN